MLFGRGNVDVSVSSFEYASRDARWMIVTRLLRNLTFDQIARGLKIEHEDLCLQQRGRDLLAFSGRLSLK